MKYIVALFFMVQIIFKHIAALLKGLFRAKLSQKEEQEYKKIVQYYFKVISTIIVVLIPIMVFKMTGFILYGFMSFAFMATVIVVMEEDFLWFEFIMSLIIYVVLLMSVSANTSKEYIVHQKHFDLQDYSSTKQYEDGDVRRVYNVLNTDTGDENSIYVYKDNNPKCFDRNETELYYFKYESKDWFKRTGTGELHLSCSDNVIAKDKK